MCDYAVISNLLRVVSLRFYIIFSKMLLDKNQLIYCLLHVRLHRQDNYLAGDEFLIAVSRKYYTVYYHSLQ